MSVASPSSVVRAGRVAAALVVGVLVLVGCTPAKHQASATAPTASGGSDVAADLQPFYGQSLEWTECGELQCATATAPLDWADPTGPTITLALSRQPALGGEAIGSLLLNPGGPGASGVDFLESAVAMVSESVQQQYDLVAFDPRGVAGSSPVACVDAPALDEILATDLDTSDAGLQEAQDRYGAFGAACLENTGDLLAHVDTVSVARDLDMLRSALGDDALTYLGFSYGTEIGATYAALFPGQVGRLVLDGALDPTLSSTELAVGQAGGFENALRAYVADCQAGSDCPLTGDVDKGLAQIKDLLDRAAVSPLDTGTDRALTSSLAFYGIALPLYSQESWPYLTQALAAALQEDDGSVLLYLADLYSDRNPDGTYSSNSSEAFWAVGCADERASADVATMRAEAEQIEAVAPTVGAFFGYGGVICAQWPTPVSEPLESYTAEGAAPILVIGTTNDPATPYAWAQSLAETLSSGTLLTYEGEGHTAYGSSNSCVADAVDGYLLTGEVPAEGTRC
ncbi:alpha/beta hydrolase [Cellulomonas soli]|uniref:alpha/beta hydrolase n=1 Tax=Cellulomonas soli TaxID=931535 RepID=UPI003F85900D